VLRNNFGREKKRVNIDFKHMNEMNKSNLLLPVPSTFHAPSLLGHTQNLFLLLLFISPLYLLLLLRLFILRSKEGEAERENMP
jgi:hypothetical protein